MLYCIECTSHHAHRLFRLAADVLGLRLPVDTLDLQSAPTVSLCIETAECLSNSRPTQTMSVLTTPGHTTLATPTAAATPVMTTVLVEAVATPTIDTVLRLLAMVVVVVVATTTIADTTTDATTTATAGATMIAATTGITTAGIRTLAATPTPVIKMPSIRFRLLYSLLSNDQRCLFWPT